jgi:hypothetical protein
MIRDSAKIFVIVFAISLCSKASATGLSEKPTSPPNQKITAVKPWLDDAALFQSTAGPQRWIIGQSKSPCLSEMEANEKACADAASQLARIVSASPEARGAAADQLRRYLVAELVVGRLIIDRSVSRIHKPYGDLWSEAILIEASPDQVRAVAGAYAARRREYHHTLAGRFLALVGIGVAILLLHWVLNTVTKGYFRGQVRLGMVLSFGLLACMLIRLCASSG